MIIAANGFYIVKLKFGHIKLACVYRFAVELGDNDLSVKISGAR